MQQYQDVKEWLQRLNRLEFTYRVTEASSYGGCITKKYSGRSLFADPLIIEGWNTQKEAIDNTMRQCKPLNNSQFAIVVMMCEMVKNKRLPTANRIADYSSQVMI